MPVGTSNPLRCYTAQYAGDLDLWSVAGRCSYEARKNRKLSKSGWLSSRDIIFRPHQHYIEVCSPGFQSHMEISQNLLTCGTETSDF